MDRRAAIVGGTAALGLAAVGAARKEGAAMEATPTIFAPHGGGPWPVLDLPMFNGDETRSLAGYMKSIASVPAQTPEALLVVSAHWEEATFTVNTGAAPSLYFDYGGFPDAAYRFTWPAPGSPEVAEKTLSLLADAGLKPERNHTRGYDHGTFIPLMLAYPEAQVPVVQVSLKRGLDPAEHLALGKALAPLREQGVFIIGSGNSYHNLRGLFRPNPSVLAQAREFDTWLNDAIAAPERAELLKRWEQAPAARPCHPREEHLIPLLVAAGAAEGAQGHVTWRGTTNGIANSAHQFS